MKTFTTLAASMLAALSITSLADNVTIPNTFSAGTPAVAAQVNDNFAAVEAAVDDNAANIAANTTAITGKQNLVTGTCAAGSSIRAINADGSVACETDDVGFGDITSVTAGTGISGGGTTGDVSISADTNYLQRRVSSTCPTGSSIRTINADGSVACEADDVGSGDITSVTAGTGLSGGSTTGDATISADTNYLQRRVSSSCPTGSSIRVINSDGSIACEADDVGSGDITGVTAGAGLTGGGTTGSVTLNLASGYVSVSSYAFTNEDSSIDQASKCVLNKVNAGAVYFNLNLLGADTAGCDAVASIQLPHGATLSTLMCTVLDSNANNSFTAYLRRTSYYGGGNSDVFVTASSTDSALTQLIGDSTPVAGAEIVDNATYSYYLRVDWSTNNFNLLTGAELYGCRVLYTY